MNLRCAVTGLAFTFVLSLWANAAPAEEVVEAWRSPYGRPWSVSVNQSDGSCWVAAGASVMHVAGDGSILSQTNGFTWPKSVSVNSQDGSCWVGDIYDDAVAHLAADGAELWRGGSFSSPGAVSVNSSDGSCWVADRGNGQVVHLAGDGAELWRGGSFASPVSVSVNAADGSCWVADPGNDQVVHLAGDGTELWRGGGLNSPGFVSVNPTDGSCWVAQSWQHEVVHLADDGAELSRAEGFDDPVSVSVNPSDGSCWVADSWQHVVVHLDEDGAELSRAEGFDDPMSVSVNPTDGSCWVADNDRAEVVRLAQDGTELWRARSFLTPVFISVDANDGSCWVVDLDHHDLSQNDYRNSDVVHLSAEGAELWRGQGFDTPWGISANPTDGSCWAVASGYLVRLGADGTELARAYLTDFAGYPVLCVNPADGSCWVAAAYGTQVIHLARDGTELWRGDDFWGPCGVAANPSDGSCWVADTQRGQVARLAIVGWEPPTFRDVPYHFWAHDQVDACVAADIVGGYPDGLYHPDWSVSRDQMAVFISRALAGGDGNVPDGPDTATFDDVPTDHWAYEYVEYCVAEGVVQGFDPVTYAPTVIVARDAMAVFISRAVAGGDDNVPDGPAEATFDDVPTNHWAYKYVEYCVAQGIVQGYDPITYGPTITVSRDQMAVYICRAFGLPMYAAAARARQGPRELPS